MSQITSTLDVWNYLKSQNACQTEVQPFPKYGWLSIFCSLIHPASHLPPELMKEKDALIQVSTCCFLHDDATHTQMLRTLFNKLTGLNCPSLLGTHWEIIGFQGLDPATDFRSVGMLGLFQPLAVSLITETLPFILDVVSLSHSPRQGFPFMVLSLNVTNIILKTIRDGHLDKLITQKGSVLEVATSCYSAILFYIYDNWKKDNLTLVDSGPLLKKAEVLFRKDADQCIKHFESYIEALCSASRIATANLDDVQLQLNELDNVSEDQDGAISTSP